MQAFESPTLAAGSDLSCAAFGGCSTCMNLANTVRPRYFPEIT